MNNQIQTIEVRLCAMTRCPVMHDKAMSGVWQNPEKQDEGTGTSIAEDDQDGLSFVPVTKHPASEISTTDPHCLNPGSCCASTEHSPPSSFEPSGLLSLPWEMVARIASHLPAQCVITVLPKVCQALSSVGNDGTAWQLRARRLTGSQAGFPVGPRETFDWPRACLEMEQLITCWSHQADRVGGQGQEGDAAERERMAGRGEPAPGGENGGADVEGVGVAAQEVAFGVHEVLEVPLEGENCEMQPGAREPGNKLAPLDAQGAADEAEPRPAGGDGGGHVAMDVDQGLPSRSPSPPPALERISLPSGHIAPINTVLLVGDDGALCASGSRDRNVNLWDLREGSNGTLLRTLGGRGCYTTHRGWVWCLAARGPLLASGSFDSTVRLWDLGAGGAERGLINTQAAVLCLACHDDVLLAGTFDKKVSIYDTRVAEPLVKSLHLHGNSVMCLVADEQYIISGSKDRTVAVYDRRAGKALKKIRLSSYLLSMSYSDTEIWAGDNRGMIHAFSMQAGVLKPLSQFDVGHASLVTGVHSSPGSLYTCSSDRIKVHLPSAPPRTLCTLHRPAGVNGLSVAAGILAAASGDMCVEVWRPRE